MTSPISITVPTDPTIEISVTSPDVIEVDIVNGADGVPEAPVDGEYYARRNAAWSSLPGFNDAADGEILIGNGAGYTVGTITAGANITITNTPGGIQIDSTGGGSSSLTATYLGYGDVSNNLTGTSDIVRPSARVLSVGLTTPGVDTALNLRGNSSSNTELRWVDESGDRFRFGTNYAVNLFYFEDANFGTVWQYNLNFNEFSIGNGVSVVVQGDLNIYYDSPSVSIGNDIGNVTITTKTAGGSNVLWYVKSDGFNRWQTQIGEFGLLYRTYDAAGLYQDSPLTIPNSPASPIGLGRAIGTLAIIVTDGYDITFGSTTGTKIGTSTTDKLAFYNSAPVVKPTGNLLTAIALLGLVGAPTITSGDVSGLGTMALQDAGAVSISGGTAVLSSVTDSGLTAGRVTFAGTSGLLSDDSVLTWDSTNKTLIINKNTVALPAPQTPADTLLHLGNADSTSARLLIDAWGSGFSPVFTGRFARNTAASPQACQAGDALVALNAIGYGATAYGTVSNAAFYLGANETWTDSTHSTKAVLELTLTGSIVRSVVLTILPTATTILHTDAATNSVSGIYVLNHATSGTPAVGYGQSFTMNGFDDGAATQRLMAQFATSWTDAASATRSSKLNINITANAAQLQVLSLTPTGSVFTTTDAVTAAATTVLTISHTSTGTVANGFGTAFVFNAPDDGGTLRGMATLSASWTTAASATRAAKITISVQVAAVSTVGFTLASTSATFAAGFPVTISDTTASTTAGTGSVIIAGGMGITGQITSSSAIVLAGNLRSASTVISDGSIAAAATTGRVAFWRSGGTYLGTSAGDMVFQTDLANVRGYYFTAGTTPAVVASISGTGVFSALSGTFSSLTSGRVPYASTAGLLVDDSAFTRGSLTFSVDSSADIVATLGYGKLGLSSSGTSTVFYVAQTSCFNSTDYALSQSSVGDTNINAKTAKTVALKINNASRFTLTSAIATCTSTMAVNPVNVTSGLSTALLVTGAANTGQTTLTEDPDIYFNLARIVTWATGNITAQRAVKITAPTYAFNGASVISKAATVAISGPPAAGTNATLTATYSFWVESGISQFDGAVSIGDANDISFGTSTGTKLGTTSSQKIGLWGATPIVQKTGYGTPTGGSVVSSYPGASATLGQTSGTLAQLLLDLKAAGVIGA